MSEQVRDHQTVAGPARSEAENHQQKIRAEQEGEESSCGCSACEKQLGRRGGLRGKWKPFWCRARSGGEGVGVGGVFMGADTPSFIQLQVSGLCAHELVSVMHDVRGCREEEGLMCWWVGQERRGRTRVQSGSGNREGELGIS